MSRSDGIVVAAEQPDTADILALLAERDAHFDRLDADEDRRPGKNFIWSPGQPVTLLDLGRFGLADRYQDLAVFLRSAKRNHHHIDAPALLREHYPLAEVDERACEFYWLLDEFF